jgi:hypothetical protein
MADYKESGRSCVTVQVLISFYSSGAREVGRPVEHLLQPKSRHPVAISCRNADMLYDLFDRRSFVRYAALAGGGILLCAATDPGIAVAKLSSQGSTMARTPFNFIANFKANPGREGDLQRILTAMVAPTRAEEGCVNYDLHVHVDDPSRFTLYEAGRVQRRLTSI